MKYLGKEEIAFLVALFVVFLGLPFVLNYKSKRVARTKYVIETSKMRYLTNFIYKKGYEISFYAEPYCEKVSLLEPDIISKEKDGIFRAGEYNCVWSTSSYHRYRDYDEHK